MRVGEAMTSPAITVRPDTSCKEAAGLLARHRISALPVVDGRGRLVGIVSEADLLPLEAVPDPRALATPVASRREPLPSRVEEVMTREVVSVDEGADLGRLLAAEGLRLAGLQVRVRDGVVELSRARGAR